MVNGSWLEKGVDATADTVTTDTARCVWERNRSKFDAIAEHYAQHWHLHPPERTLLERQRGHWHESDMLDIGVGGGRTSFTFAAITRSYVGVDYSPRMIDISRRVIGEDERVRFEVCDARDLAASGMGRSMSCFTALTASTALGMTIA